MATKEGDFHGSWVGIFIIFSLFMEKSKELSRKAAKN